GRHATGSQLNWSKGPLMITDISFHAAIVVAVLPVVRIAVSQLVCKETNHRVLRLGLGCPDGCHAPSDAVINGRYPGGGRCGRPARSIPRLEYRPRHDGRPHGSARNCRASIPSVVCRAAAGHPPPLRVHAGTAGYAGTLVRRACRAPCRRLSTAQSSSPCACITSSSE